MYVFLDSLEPSFDICMKGEIPASRAAGGTGDTLRNAPEAP